MSARILHTVSTSLFGAFAWVLAFALLILSAALNFAAGKAVWSSEAAEFGLAIAIGLVLIDLGKFYLSSELVTACRDCRFVHAAALVALVAIGAGLSIAASFQLGRQLQAQALGTVAASKSTVAELKTQRSELKGELRLYATTQDTSVLESRMRAMRFDRRWQSTEGCTKATASTSRAFCARHGLMFADLAAANKAQQLRTKIDQLTNNIAQRTNAASHTVQLAGLASVAAMIGVKTDHAASILMTAIAVAFEAFSIAVWSFAPRLKSTTVEVAAEAIETDHNEGVEAPKMEQPIATHRSRPVCRDIASQAEPITEPLSPNNVTWLKQENTGGSARKIVKSSALKPMSQTVVQIASANTVDQCLSPAVQAANQFDAFSTACLTRKSSATAPAKMVREVFEDWCSQRGIEPMSQNAFGRLVTDRGIKRARIGKGGAFAYRGIQIIEQSHGS